MEWERNGESLPLYLPSMLVCRCVHLHQISNLPLHILTLNLLIYKNESRNSTETQIAFESQNLRKTPDAREASQWSVSLLFIQWHEMLKDKRL